MYNRQSLNQMKSRPVKMEQSNFESFNHLPIVSDDDYDLPQNPYLQYETNQFSNVNSRNVRGLSSQSFYETHGGYTIHEVSAMEGFGNDSDPQFDLGKDGSFNDYSVLVGNFQTALEGHFQRNPLAALQKKGFQVTYICVNERDSYRQLIDCLVSKQHDVAWIISQGHDIAIDLKDEFINAVESFYNSNRGLMLWADNTPYLVQASYILERIAGATLINDTPGNRVLSYGDPKVPGEFDQEHIIFAGLNYLYEGVTICYPVDFENQESKLITLATSSNNFPCICYIDSSEQHGRLVLDTGWTKIYDSYWNSAGQARYVINSTVYLVDIERRFGGAIISD